MTRLSGKSALVTGGAKGIGRAISVALAREGASVLIGDIDDAEGLAAVNDIREAGGAADYRRCDVSLEADIVALVEQAAGAEGRLDVAVNNAGFTPGRSRLSRLSLDDWNTVLAVNLTSVFLGLRSQMNLMSAAEGGSIINMASTAAFRGSLGLGAYSASKHAIIGLTRSAALEGAAKGVRVNAICPGAIRTPLMDSTFTTEAERAAITRLSPIGRMGRPEEVAGLAVWLSTEEAAFVTGAAFTVDGGMTAQ